MLLSKMENMIKVFRTNVWRQWDADYVIAMLREMYAGYKITIDLDDCDKVLRVEGAAFRPEDIIRELEKMMFLCAEME